MVASWKGLPHVEVLRWLLAESVAFRLLFSVQLVSRLWPNSVSEVFDYIGLCVELGLVQAIIKEVVPHTSVELPSKLDTASRIIAAGTHTMRGWYDIKPRDPSALDELWCALFTHRLVVALPAGCVTERGLRWRPHTHKLYRRPSVRARVWQALLCLHRCCPHLLRELRYLILTMAMSDVVTVGGQAKGGERLA
jgi:hypothetical protein